MKIISGGKKDYYDYLTGIYGIDEHVVYDRRDGQVFKLFSHGYQIFVKEHDRWSDKHREMIRKYHYVNGKGKLDYIPQGKLYYFILEIGFNQLLFQIERYLDDNNEVQLVPTLLEKKEIKKKRSTAPVSYIPVDCYKSYLDNDYNINNYRMYDEVKNPIFSGTWVTSFIPAEEMYDMIYNYLLAIKEPEIIDSRSNDQKIESFGFDTKTSFRNPVINANSKKKK